MAKKNAADDRNARLVKGAEQRAQIIAWLEANPGLQAARDIQMGTGIDPEEIHNRLYNMAQSGLIPRTKDGKGGTFYSAPSNPVMLDAAPAADAPKRTRRTKAQMMEGMQALRAGPGTGDIELVMSGFLIVLGRNPATGRLRIMLEEASND